MIEQRQNDLLPTDFESAGNDNFRRIWFRAVYTAINLFINFYYIILCQNK